MASAQLSVALQQARTFLNDTNATVWTDENLIPSMQQADQELQMQLWNIGSPVVRQITPPIPVPAGYGIDITALLPSDFLIPTLGFESGLVTAVLTSVVVSGLNATYAYSSSVGTPVVGALVNITGFSTLGNNVTGVYIISVVPNTSFTVLVTTQVNETHAGTANISDNNWIPLTEQYYPTLGYIATSTLTYWNWKDEKLSFSGVTVPRLVAFQYRREIPIPAAATDPIGITFGEMYLGARGAAIAAGAVGNSAVAQILDGEANKNFSMVLTANRGQQKPINKP